MKLLFLNGPNLNLLGQRESDPYGRTTLAEIEALARKRARELAAEVDFRQSNSEGDLVTWVQGAAGRYDCIILNAGPYAHTSLALHDALTAVRIPTIEVRLANNQAGDKLRRRSLLAPACLGIIAGFGPLSYLLAVEAAVNLKPPPRPGR